MGNRRQSKKERSQVFQLLANTYAEHKVLDQFKHWNLERTNWAI
ncbi:hypothetical protein [Enterococcus sp. BWR-S5]|nr:hypothetical protein [Enterococcus sp. BWR-S5]